MLIYVSASDEPAQMMSTPCTGNICQALSAWSHNTLRASDLLGDLHYRAILVQAVQGVIDNDNFDTCGHEQHINLHRILLGLLANNPT